METEKKEIKRGQNKKEKHDRGRERAEKTDRLTQQWGVQRVVLIVAMGTQDTFNLHIWGHEWGRGHLRQKLFPRLLAGGTQRAQVQSVWNVDAHICPNKISQVIKLLELIYFNSFIQNPQHQRC